MRFARMLVNEGELDGVRILQPESVRKMATDQLPDDIGDLSWLPGKGQVGFGVNVAVRVAPPASTEENNGVVGECFSSVDRKSTRLNSSHVAISYAVFCLKKKNTMERQLYVRS